MTRAALLSLFALALAACADPVFCRVRIGPVSTCFEQAAPTDADRAGLALWCAQQRGAYAESARCDRAALVAQCQGITLTASSSTADAGSEAGSEAGVEAGADAAAADAGAPVFTLTPPSVAVNVLYSGDINAARNDCAMRGGTFVPVSP